MAETKIADNLSTFPETKRQNAADLEAVGVMKTEMHVHLMVVMGIEINIDRIPGIRNLVASGMTRLSAAQREQAIGRLQAG